MVKFIFFTTLLDLPVSSNTQDLTFTTQEDSHRREDITLSIQDPLPLINTELQDSISNSAGMRSNVKVCEQTASAFLARHIVDLDSHSAGTPHYISEHDSQERYTTKTSKYQAGCRKKSKRQTIQICFDFSHTTHTVDSKPANIGNQ